MGFLIYRLIIFVALFFIISLGSGCGESRYSKDQLLAQHAGAPLLEGLGNFNFTISTDNDDAQRYFNQGLVLAFAFNHAESVRSFQAAQKLDPQCAMCFWGESLARGPNINVTSDGRAVMSSEDRRKAFSVYKQALYLVNPENKKEKAYINALSKRYNGDITTSREPLDKQYALAMQKLVNDYPDDITAASLYAEALMNTMPWNYWTEEGSPREDTKKVINNLESVLERDQNHPLAIHLYIHAVEASKSPERAEKAADRLAKLVPGAGHLVHMPAHIYWRVGRYHDASQANINAAKVDEKYIAQCNAQGFYPALYYPHNIHFLWAASMMEGRSKLSIESALKVSKYVHDDQIKKFPTIEFFKTIPLLSYVRFQKWEEILMFPQLLDGYKFSQGILHYAKGVAYASKGEIQKAIQEQLKIVPLKDSNEIRLLIKGGQPSGLLLDIANELLLGEINFAKKDFNKASYHFSKAVDIQDSLPYTEPPFWYYPTRQSLGVSLMKENKFLEAEKVYKRDLKDYPRNGWSMFGLSKALESQNKNIEANQVQKKFEDVWQMADIDLKL